MHSCLNIVECMFADQICVNLKPQTETLKPEPLSGGARKSGKKALTVLAAGDLPRNRVLRVVSIELFAGLQQDG